MFRRVLVPLDRSPLAEQALDVAAEIAKATTAPIDLMLAHERLLGMNTDNPYDLQQRDQEDRYLESIADQLQRDQQVRASHSVLVGPPAAMIATRAHDVGADLIVMTSHGRTGWSRAFLGSVADAVVRLASIPVLLLRPEGPVTTRGTTRPVLRRMLVPLDGSSLAASILGPASRVARCLHARITLLRVVAPATVLQPVVVGDMAPTLVIEDRPATHRAVDIAREELEENAALLGEQGCVGVECHHLVASNPAAAIAEFVANNAIDLVAMSTHGRGASRLLVGSVADAVLRSTRAAVLLNRPPRTREDRAVRPAWDLVVATT